MHSRVLYRLTFLAAGLSLGHHLDHLIRGNAVGWPVTDQVNAFTASLVVYPIIIAGLVLYRAGRVGPGFWALVSGGGAVFVSAVHFGPAAGEPPELILGRDAQPAPGGGAFSLGPVPFGPAAVDPPALILGHYAQPVLGWLAFGWLVVFVTVLAITSIYETRLWGQQRQGRHPHHPDA